MVVVSSNFWDLASWFANGDWSVEGMPSETEILSDDVLMQWTANMTKILTHLKVSPSFLPSPKKPPSLSFASL